MTRLLARLGVDGPQVIKFLVQHGLLGYAEPQPMRHRHFYRQRFAFDELGAGSDAISIERDYFFLHPALKDWALSRPDRLVAPLHRLASGVIGDRQAFESMPPLVRLAVHDGRVSLKFRVGNRVLQAHGRGRTAMWWQVLFVALCAFRAFQRRRINVEQLQAVWNWIQRHEGSGGALRGTMLIKWDDAAERFRDWAKKVNQANVIQQLQKHLLRPSGKGGLKPARETCQVAAKLPFLSVNAASDMKDVVVLSFPSLPSNEVDWDERLERWMLQLPGTSPQTV